MVPPGSRPLSDLNDSHGGGNSEGVTRARSAGTAVTRVKGGRGGPLPRREGPTGVRQRLVRSQLPWRRQVGDGRGNLAALNRFLTIGR